MPAGLIFFKGINPLITQAASSSWQRLLIDAASAVCSSTAAAARAISDAWVVRSAAISAL